ncbi:uncharacterized protein BCR38DRAFT_424212 [Pseudomassariella vexata]|uniref:Uncharacterized protein n=1 Tax=Pseudomassariella vexata TaxID=1141098 RepID=A0A1Y2EB06_9PEZI|nr:uncharacterized protein BCR38DRAFT_424212 [Pseudomassariella vexata]ORY68741.1 hypothetical protein BCR38DRAFT_424212 [Pseudomassariella vexata]
MLYGPFINSQYYGTLPALIASWAVASATPQGGKLIQSVYFPPSIYVTFQSRSNGSSAFALRQRCRDFKPN